MTHETFLMNGYGLYVWSSFIFTLICFIFIYCIINLQLRKEKEKFKTKYSDLDVEKTSVIKVQGTYREILIFTKISKI